MKRNFAKKLLCGALSLLTVLAAAPMSSFAAEADSAQSGFSDATVYLIDLSGKKIVCVGDSLTYGDYGTTVHGKGYPHAENYPYYLAKYTGASVEWYACGGYTAKALARDYSNGVFSGIGRPGVSVSVKDADIVLVMLGTNGGLPLVGDRSNYDACLSLANNLKNDVKKGAKVVLMTPPPATTDESKVNYGYAPNVASAYAGIYKIAGNLSLPVFDVYRDAGFSDENEALFRPNDGLLISKRKTIAGGRILSISFTPQTTATLSTPT